MTDMETIAWEGGAVSAVWDGTPSDRCLILGHGAGGTLATPGLARIAAAYAAAGLPTMRFNFAYSEAGRKAPDRAPILEAVWRAAAEHARARAPRLLLGGRSMGGRIASHIAAQGTPCEGLVFLGYPLHPPDKPERIRDAHLPDVPAPMLFIQGTRDPFSTPELLRATVERLPRAQLHVVEGGDHSLVVRGRPAAEVDDEIVGVTVAWMSRSSGAG